MSDLRPGDILELGPHRLVCGDCCDGLLWSRAWGGAPYPAFLLADPPYGCSVDPEIAAKKAEQARTARANPLLTHEWDRYTPEDLDRWFTVLPDRIHAQGAVIFWGWKGSIGDLLAIAPDANPCLTVAAIYTWAKPAAGSKFWATMPLILGCEYAVIFRQRAGLRFQQDFNLRDFIVHHLPAAERADAGEKGATVKALAVLTPLIRKFSAPGDTVLIPFGGWGSELLACDLTGRRALVFEKSPHRCRLIAERWERHLSRVGVSRDAPAEARAGRQARLDLKAVMAP